MKRFILILIIFYPALGLAQPPEKNLPPGNPQFGYRPSERPDRLLLSWKEDPSTSFTVTWRTSESVGNAYAEIAESDASPAFEDYETETEATTMRMEALFDTAAYHEVTFRNLKPGTNYMYRVRNGDYRSEWIQVCTAPVTFEPFRFIYMGDAQNDLYDHWSRAIRAAYSRAPDAKFILHAGDLVNHSQNDYEWGEWFEAMGFIARMVPNLATPGNHEYIKNSSGHKTGISPFWEAQFAVPENGPENAIGLSYYIDYPGMRLISLNSNEFYEEQEEWLREVLSENNQRWTVVFFHHPIFSAARGRANADLEKKWRPVLEAQKVDLVLQGHDHAYARGTFDSRNSPVYVVSVSGPKMYEITDQAWMQRAAENTQLFQIVEVENDKLVYRSITVDGKVYDAFEIQKSETGNKLIELPVEAEAQRMFRNTLKEND